jgi:aryl-alcohol dehydrogenase-like predicted oxidoreductase
MVGKLARSAGREGIQIATKVNPAATNSMKALTAGSVGGFSRDQLIRQFDDSLATLGVPKV